MVPPDTSLTRHPRWVQTAEKPLKSFALGCVMTTLSVSSTTPPSTGTSPVVVRISAPPLPPPEFAPAVGPDSVGDAAGVDELGSAVVVSPPQALSTDPPATTAPPTAAPLSTVRRDIVLRDTGRSALGMLGLLERGRSFERSWRDQNDGPREQVRLASCNGTLGPGRDTGFTVR